MPADSMKNDPKVLFGWAMYDWANSAYITTAGAIIAAFFTSTIVPDDGYAGVSGETIWAAGVSIGAFVLFLAMPVLGAVADYASTKRRFLIVSASIGSIFTMLVPFAPDGAVPLFILLFLVSNIGFVAGNVFYDGFLPLISTDATIDRVSSRGFAYGYIGGGLYILLAFIFIVLSGDDSITGLSTETAARCAIFRAGIWWIGFTILSVRRLPEPGRAEAIPARYRGDPKWVAYARIGFGRTAATARKLLGFKEILLFVIAFIFYNDGTQTVIAVSGAYAEDTLGLDTEEIIIVFLIVQFVAFFGALLFGALADGIGTKRAILASLTVWSLVAVAAFFLPEGRAAPLYVLGAVVGLVLGGVQALSRSLYGSMIPEAASAEFYGFFSVFSKFSAIWGPLVFALISGITGSGRPAIISIVAFFVIGMVLLALVDVEAGRESRSRWLFRGAEATVSDERRPG